MKGTETMYKVLMLTRCDFDDGSELYFRKRISLPFVPYPGLQIHFYQRDDFAFMNITDVAWDTKYKRFECTCIEQYSDGKRPANHIVGTALHFTENGWSVEDYSSDLKEELEKNGIVL
jgi:hypothetical protein